MKALIPFRVRSSVTIFEPNKGLETIAVAEVAEKHFARAKNVEGLFKAVEEKLKAQRDYIVWRDDVVPATGFDKEGKRFRTETLPDADPGRLVAHRWRNRLKKPEHFARALTEARERCTRICEQDDTGAPRGTRMEWSI